MDVNVYVNYWKDLPIFRLTVKTYYPFVKRIFVDDGRYEEFPDEGIVSNDGIKEYCSANDKLIYVPSTSVWPTQMIKRGSMFSLIPTDEWILVIDADEALIDAKLLYETVAPRGKFVGRLLEIFDIPGDPSPQTRWHWRLIHNRKGFSFGRNHFELMYKGEAVSQDQIWDTKLKLLHFRDVRTPERLKQKDTYYRKRKEVGVNVIELG